MRRFIALVILVCATPSLTQLRAQSLAEVAAREKKRREAQAKATPGKPAPSFTDDDLRGRSPDESTGKAKKSPGTAPASSAPSETESTGTGRSSMDLADESKRRLAEDIRGRLISCKDEVEAAQEMVKRMEAYLAALEPARYYNGEAHRQDVERQIKQARTEVEATRRRCDEIEDEARKGGVPPGWIR